MAQHMPGRALAAIDLAALGIVELIANRRLQTGGDYSPPQKHEMKKRSREAG
jgi:hypothetical protein